MRITNIKEDGKGKEGEAKVYITEHHISDLSSSLQKVEVSAKEERAFIKSNQREQNSSVNSLVSVISSLTNTNQMNPVATKPHTPIELNTTSLPNPLTNKINHLIKSTITSFPALATSSKNSINPNTPTDMNNQVATNSLINPKPESPLTNPTYLPNLIPLSELISMVGTIKPALHSLNPPVNTKIASTEFTIQPKLHFKQERGTNLLENPKQEQHVISKKWKIQNVAGVCKTKNPMSVGVKRNENHSLTDEMDVDGVEKKRGKSNGDKLEILTVETVWQSRRSQ